MKKIYLIRHSIWDHDTGYLSEEGKKLCAEIKKLLPSFTYIICTNSPRTHETALLLTGKPPVSEPRLGPLKLSKEDHKILVDKSKKNQYGIAGAILDTPELIEPLKKLGETTVNFLHDMIKSLKDGENALVVSHDGIIVATEKIIRNEPFDKINNYYNPLQGMIINEKFEIEYFKNS